MILTLTGKIILVTAIASIATGTGIYFLINNSNTKSIPKTRNKLDEVGYLVLDESSLQEDWNKVLEEYKKIKTSDDIFEGSTIGSENIKGLKEKCKDAINDSHLNLKKYSLAKRWCVKEETIKGILERKQYTKIVVSTDSSNKSKWVEKINKLKLLAESERNIKITLGQDENANVSALEKICTDLNIDNSKTHSNKEFEVNLKQAMEWCFFK